MGSMSTTFETGIWGCSHHHRGVNMRVFATPPGWDIRVHLLHHQGWDVGVLLPPSGQGHRGVHTTQHTAYLLTIFHCFSLRELRPSHLVPSPLDRPVQELLHLPLREDIGVPQQLVFVLIDCSEGWSGSAAGLWSTPTLRRVHAPSPKLPPG